MPQIEKIQNGEFSEGTFEFWEIQAALSVTFAALYDTTINANVANGSLVGTPVGIPTPTVENGRLDLTGPALRYVDYDAESNADQPDGFTVEWLLTPNYQTKPSVWQAFWSISQGPGSLVNAIEFRHSSAQGQIQLRWYDKDGVSMGTVTMANWMPKKDQEYQLSLNVDLASGATFLYIDGKIHDAVISTIGERSNDIGLLRVGSDVAGVEQSDFQIRDLVIYNEVIRTGEYEVTPLAVPKISTYPEIGYSVGDEYPGYLAALQEGSEDGALVQTVAIDPEEIGQDFVAKACLGRLSEFDSPKAQIKFCDSSLAVVATFELLPDSETSNELIEKSFRAKIPTNAAFLMFRLELATSPAQSPNTVAADCLSFGIHKDLVKYQDTYATLAEIDAALFNNKRWDSWDVEDKEQFLEAATQTIDKALTYAGERVDESQPLEFPRAFSTYQTFFETDKQEKQLVFAMTRQIEFLLESTEMGVADDTKNFRLGLRNELAPLAYKYIQGYATRW